MSPSAIGSTSGTTPRARLGVDDTPATTPVTAPGGRAFGPDLLKAAAIFGVVLIHGAWLLSAPGGEATRRVLEDVSRFAVPSFVLLWAFFYERGYARATDRRAYARQRFTRLAIPFAFWTAVYVVVFWARGGTIRAADLLTGYWTGYGWPGQYYFVVLFQLIVLFPALRAAATDRGTSAVVVAGAALYGAILAGAGRIPLVVGLADRLFLYWVPYAVVGAWAYRRWGGRPGRGAHPALVALAVLSVALIPLELAAVRARGPLFSPYVALSVLLAGVLLPLVALRSARVAGRGVVDRVVHGVGARTFGVFCLNPLVVQLLDAPLAPVRGALPSFGPATGLVYALSSAVLVLCVSLLLAAGIARTPLRPVVQP